MTLIDISFTGSLSTSEPTKSKQWMDMMDPKRISNILRWNNRNIENHTPKQYFNTRLNLVLHIGAIPNIGRIQANFQTKTMFFFLALPWNFKENLAELPTNSQNSFQGSDLQLPTHWVWRSTAAQNQTWTSRSVKFQSNISGTYPHIPPKYPKNTHMIPYVKWFSFINRWLFGFGVYSTGLRLELRLDYRN